MRNAAQTFNRAVVDRQGPTMAVMLYHGLQALTGGERPCLMDNEKILTDLLGVDPSDNNIRRLKRSLEWLVAQGFLERYVRQQGRGIGAGRILRITEPGADQFFDESMAQRLDSLAWASVRELLFENGSISPNWEQRLRNPPLDFTRDTNVPNKLLGTQTSRTKALGGTQTSRINGPDSQHSSSENSELADASQSPKNKRRLKIKKAEEKPAGLLPFQDHQETAKTVDPEPFSPTEPKPPNCPKGFERIQDSGLRDRLAETCKCLALGPPHAATKFPGAYQFVNQLIGENVRPDAIERALSQLVACPVKSPWPYAESVARRESASRNEADHIHEHQRFRAEESAACDVERRLPAPW